MPLHLWSGFQRQIICNFGVVGCWPKLLTTINSRYSKKISTTVSTHHELLSFYILWFWSICKSEGHQLGPSTSWSAKQLSQTWQECNSKCQKWGFDTGSVFVFICINNFEVLNDSEDLIHQVMNNLRSWNCLFHQIVQTNLAMDPMVKFYTNDTTQSSPAPTSLNEIQPLFLQLRGSIRALRCMSVCLRSGT